MKASTKAAIMRIESAQVFLDDARDSIENAFAALSPVVGALPEYEATQKLLLDLDELRHSLLALQQNDDTLRLDSEPKSGGGSR